MVLLCVQLIRGSRHSNPGRGSPHAEPHPHQVHLLGGLIMFDFYANSAYGCIAIGRVQFTWLNRTRGYSGGFSSLALMGGDVEWSLDFHENGIEVTRMERGDIVRTRQLFANL